MLRNEAKCRPALPRSGAVLFERNYEVRTPRLWVGLSQCTRSVGPFGLLLGAEGALGSSGLKCLLGHSKVDAISEPHSLEWTKSRRSISEIDHGALPPPALAGLRSFRSSTFRSFGRTDRVGWLGISAFLPRAASRRGVPRVWRKPSFLGIAPGRFLGGLEPATLCLPSTAGLCRRGILADPRPQAHPCCSRHSCGFDCARSGSASRPADLIHGKLRRVSGLACLWCGLCRHRWAARP
jgi:hypothetical protein